MLELNRKFIDFYKLKARYKIAYGGRAGSKSHNVALMLLMLGKENKKQIVCLREYQKNLEESVYRLLCNKIRADDSFSSFYRIMSDKIVGVNGTEFTFSGIKNAKNFKSFEGADIAWVEEGQSISQESMLIMIPTIRKPSSEIWFTFNPDSEHDPVYKMACTPLQMTDQELENNGYDVAQLNLQINYYDNPHCPAIMKKEAENLKQADYELYRWVWLGECRTLSDAIIFKNKFEVLDFEVKEYQQNTNIPTFNDEFIKMNYGLDFGWVHPTAIIQSFIYNNCLYVNDEVCRQEMDTDDITLSFINELSWFNVKKDVIYADSARPDLIDILNRNRLSKDGSELPRLDVRKANKNQGSVKSGIIYLKTFRKIYIHSRCKITIDNFRKYSHKKDKNDVITQHIAEIDDDCIDALRYSYTDLMTKGNGIDWNATDWTKL